MIRPFAPAIAVAAGIILLAFTAFAFDPESLPEVGCHPDGISYWGSVMFANGMHHASRWMKVSNNWGTAIAHWNQPGFDTNGYPTAMIPGNTYRCIVYGLHNPVNEDVVTGRFVLTWKGDADIRFSGSFVGADSNCGSTGRAVDGRRAYNLTSFGSSSLMIYDINVANPPNEIKLWLPDPADPNNKALEGHFWHPLFLARVEDADWGVIRMMNVLSINANPQQDWSDRRPPSHAFMTGVLNPRPPADGFSGERSSGMAFEPMVDLCNRTTNDLWVCVPHMATDDFVTKLARLIRYGSDGDQPYTNTVAEPVHPPLSTKRRVYVEYSNEIWSNGNSFPQGNWAQDQAGLLGLPGKAEFNARRFCQIWDIFRQVFGGTNRLVRVAAVWTANESYTRSMMTEMASYCTNFAPRSEPDVVACTTYFGNGIQDWAHQKAQDQAGTADPWFYTGAYSNGRPVSVSSSDPYWSGADIERHIDEAFDEWMHRLLSGDAREGGGPDAVGVGGGFAPWLHELSQTNFSNPKPIVAYEGGPSIYTDYMDMGGSFDDGITTFMNAMNRRPRVRDVYAAHLNMAKSKGLWMHMPFTLCSAWGKYGQWGHLEYSSQDPADAPKYRFMLDWIDEASALRHVDMPAGTVPEFNTAHHLPLAIVGKAYAADVVVSGGDGSNTLEVVGTCLTDGLSVSAVPGSTNRMRIAGVATGAGTSYAYLRVTDSDGDPAWRTFIVQAVGGPGTVVEPDFSGTNPAKNLPWTNAHVVATRVTYSGWNKGSGILVRDGDNAIVYGVNAPSDESLSTLALAIADEEYLEITVAAPGGYILDLGGAELSFTIRRIDYHAPRRYALMTSVGGFTDGNQLFSSPRSGSTADQQFSLSLPDTAAYQAISGPFAIRIYGFSGQWGGHRTSLIQFKLTADTPYFVRRVIVDNDGDGMDDNWEVTHFGSTNAVAGGPAEDFDGDGMTNEAESLAGTDPSLPGSCLRLQSAGWLDGDLYRIDWQSVSGAVYRIDTRGSLVIDPPWALIANGIDASPPVNSFTTTVSSAQSFFRVVLESAP